LGLSILALGILWIVKGPALANHPLFYIPPIGPEATDLALKGLTLAAESDIFTLQISHQEVPRFIAHWLAQLRGVNAAKTDRLPSAKLDGIAIVDGANLFSLSMSRKGDASKPNDYNQRQGHTITLHPFSGTHWTTSPDTTPA
jgi:hypothetical protein